jgi:hypothetical protein
MSTLARAHHRNGAIRYERGENSATPNADSRAQRTASLPDEGLAPNLRFCTATELSARAQGRRRVSASPRGRFCNCARRPRGDAWQRLPELPGRMAPSGFARSAADERENSIG